MNRFENKNKRAIYGHILVPFTQIFSKQVFSTENNGYSCLPLQKSYKNNFKTKPNVKFLGNFDLITVE